MKNNVTLIGMPGAGKSTVGVLLAKLLGYQFVDTDLLIQAQEEKLLWEIIRDEGIEGFHAIEERVNASLDLKRHVIATGGSVIYGEKAMEHLREISTVVYLRHDYDTIAARLGDLAQRGVTLPEGWTLRDLYNERAPLYEKYAHIVMDTNADNIQENAITLRRCLL